MIVELKLIDIHPKDVEAAEEIAGRISNKMMKEQIYEMFRYTKFHACVYGSKIIIRYR